MDPQIEAILRSGAPQPPQPPQPPRPTVRAAGTVVRTFVRPIEEREAFESDVNNWLNAEVPAGCPVVDRLVTIADGHLVGLFVVQVPVPAGPQ